jgi:REP element-mobilizing transposase RayT
MANERYELVAFCIMPNHVHLLIRSFVNITAEHQGKTAKYPLADTLRLIKGSTARECNLTLGRSGKFWHHESYDHYVRDEEEFERIIKYILNNPVKAGLVKEWNQWKFTYINPNFGSW